MENAKYPRPGRVGGGLIREVIALLRGAGCELPLASAKTSHILIGVSGGPDSIALAHLLSRYGRRVVTRDKIALLHVNHGWRAKKSDEDEAFVAGFAKDLGVRLYKKRLKVAADYEGRSWEERARELRQSFFESKAKALNAKILTAHHADDLAETVLWRLFTGAAKTHGGGIAISHGDMLRPFLKIRKSELLAYLAEEGLAYRLDDTNVEGRFLRSKMRGQLLPVVESLFPRAVEHLVDLGLEAQTKSELDVGALFAAAGLNARRAHWDLLAGGPKELDLPGGWRLKRMPGAVKKALRHEKHAPSSESWILERAKDL